MLRASDATFLRAIMVAAAFLSNTCAYAQTQPDANVSHEVNEASDHDGTLHVPSHELPLSTYMSEAAKQAFLRQPRSAPDTRSDHPVTLTPEDLAQGRRALDARLEPLLRRAKAVYAVTITNLDLNGIHAYDIRPEKGVPTGNRSRVLINLHGGGFMAGRGPLQLLESIPIAATSEIRVVSVDYRMSPEAKFPAASEDVASVYRTLLKQYRPQNIGIYGCSAGGMLTAMSVAWFQKSHLPPPGAIGIFCAADALEDGDSSHSGLEEVYPPFAWPYLSGLNVRNPLISPVLYPEILKHFPPTLLITGTRDPYMSAVVHAHSRLVEAGVSADLHVWEGMWHSFFIDVDIPESKEVFKVTQSFFARYLGGKRSDWNKAGP